MFHHRFLLVLFLIFCLSFLSVPCVPAQENMEEGASPMPETVNQETPSPSEEAMPAPAETSPAAVSSTNEVIAPPETIASAAAPEEEPSEWLWGEVVSIDPGAGMVIVKHLDYETYEEIQTTLKADDKTLFENAGALADIKAGDHLTIDYTVQDGVKVASLIVVQKDRDVSQEPAAVQKPAGTPALPQEAPPEGVSSAEMDETDMDAGMSEEPSASLPDEGAVQENMEPDAMVSSGEDTQAAQ